MMTIFWDSEGILLTDYLPRGTTINGPYYVSLLERLRSVIMEKRRGKLTQGVLLLHNNAPVHKSNIAQAAIRQAGFTELKHPAYSPDVAPTDYYLFANLKKYLRGKNFASCYVRTSELLGQTREKRERKHLSFISINVQLTRERGEERRRRQERGMSTSIDVEHNTLPHQEEIFERSENLSVKQQQHKKGTNTNENSLSAR